MGGYTKLFSSIVLSTVWRETHPTRIVWITMLAIAEADGYVGASVPGLADAARVTLEECEEALVSFLAPDRYSRSKEHEGRRIEVADGGWRILNYGKYRNSRDPEVRREQNREAQARWRYRHASKPEVSHAKPRSAHAEAEAEAEAEARERDTPRASPKGDLAPQVLSKPKRAPREKPSAVARPEDWSPSKAHRDRARQHGLDLELEVEAFKSFHDSKGNRFVSWDAAFTTWLTNRVRWNREPKGHNGKAVVQQGGQIRQGDASWLDEPKGDA